jgi:hypothetical protein
MAREITSDFPQSLLAGHPEFWRIQLRIGSWIRQNSAFERDAFAGHQPGFTRTEKSSLLGRNARWCRVDFLFATALRLAMP